METLSVRVTGHMYECGIAYAVQLIHGLREEGGQLSPSMTCLVPDDTDTGVKDSLVTWAKWPEGGCPLLVLSLDGSGPYQWECG